MAGVQAGPAAAPVVIARSPLGMPWPSEAPVHGADPCRFALPPLGVRQEPA